MITQIRSFRPNHSRMGYVATFDVYMGEVSVRDVGLFRPTTDPGTAQVRAPIIERTGRTAYGLSLEARAEIGRLATAMYEAHTGIALKYVAPPQKPPRGAVAAAEPDDAGLKRVLSAEQEACELAGI